MQAALFDSCKGYIEAIADRHVKHEAELLPAITISRETGSGAVAVGEMVVELLQRHNRGTVPWTLFDRQLVERVLSDHNLPERIKAFMPEDVRFSLNDAVEEILGLHPASWTLLEHTTDTILRLAQAGHAVIVGRGSFAIAARMPNVLHVRLVAPLKNRIRRIERLHHLTGHEAAIYIQKADRGRQRYVKRYFDADTDDPLHYHMVLNTGLLGDDEAARLIADAAIKLQTLKR